MASHPAARVGLESLRHIVLDATEARGGLGDLAGPCTTAGHLLRGLGFGGRVTLRVSDDTAETVGQLLAVDPDDPAPRPLGAGHLAIARDPLALASRTPAVDLVARLAARRGDVAPAPLPLADGGIRLTQTVLGNTEDVWGTPATAWLRDRAFPLACAGLAPGDAGVYPDDDAASLRGLPPRARRSPLAERLARWDQPDMAEALRAVLTGRVLRGADLGMVYGASRQPRARDAVRGYLAGLGRALAGRGRAAVVLAPGGVERAALSGEAAPTTVLLAGGEALPDAAAAGRVYVLPTGLLPRAVFTALLAACDLPPLLAGDGATSSAIALGRPFVLAPLDWNITNLRALRARLASLAPPGTDLVDVLFRASCYRENPSFVRLDELLAPSWEPVFLGLRAAIPCVAEHLLATVGALRTVTAPRGDPRWLAGFPDARLRRALLAARALEGDRRAWRILADELRAPDPVSPAALRVGLDLLRRAGPAPGASGLSDSLRAHLRALLQTPLDAPPVRRAVVDAALSLMPRDRTARAFVTADLDAALRGREPVVPPALRDLVDAALRAARVPWEGRVGLWIHLTRRVQVTAPPPDPRDPRTARALRAIVRALEVPATAPPPDAEQLPPAAVARACAALLQGASPSSSAR